MAEDGCHDAAQHGRAAEFLSRIDADEDVQTIKSGIAGDGQDLHQRLGRQGRVHLEGHVEQARDQAAGDEGRDDRHEDMGDFLQGQFGRRRVLAAYFFVKGLAVEGPLLIVAGIWRSGRRLFFTACFD